MGEYKMVYMVNDVVKIEMQSDPGEEYMHFRTRCRQTIASHERFHPEDEGRGHANLSDEWLVRQIW